MRRALQYLLACTALTAGCGLETDDVDAYSGFIEEESAEASGVLTFLNGPEATFEVLDLDVGLDRRAATSISEMVRGPDAAYGTEDDSRLTSIAELTSLYWVGDAAVGRILDFVTAGGGIPTLLVEDVYLTDVQAAAILAVANYATMAELDDTARLDARAARGIVAARPFSTIFALAEVPYVGRSALEKLLAHSETQEPVSSDALARAILAEHGVTIAITSFPGDEVRAQSELARNEVSFELAFRAAILSFLNDVDDGESPLEVVGDAGPYGACLDPDRAIRLVCYLNQPGTRLSIVHRDAARDLDDSYPPEHAESIQDNWAFYLNIPSIGDHLHWAIVSRTLDGSGGVSVYNYGFN